jgi:hypothetical protein
MVRRVLLILCSLFAAANGYAASGNFTAAVDRKDLYQNEHVVLTLSLTNSDTRLRAEGVTPNVDLTVLTDQFEIGVPRADFRFNIAREERRSTSEITVELFPKRSGRLTIPAFAVDGLRTQPIALQVLPLPADARPEVFARSGVAKRTLHVGEQTLLYLDLYYRTNLKQAEFGGSLETEPLQIEVHALPNQDRSEKVDGLDYKVTRSAWAVSPQSSAPVTLHLPALWIETQAGKQWRLPAQEQRITVQALRADLAPGTLAARPQLTQSTFGPATAGRIVPWQITVQAAVGLNTLPEQLPLAPTTNEFKIYFDPPERRLETQAGGGVDSIAVYKGYLMPLAAGTFTVPTIEIPYFDAQHSAVEHITLPGQTLQVAAGEQSPEEPSAPAPLVTSSAPTQPAIEDKTSALTGWQIATAGFLGAWLITLGLWWRQSASHRIRRKKIETSVTTTRGHALKQQLLAALGDARTLEQGLREWERRYGVDEEVSAAVRAVQRLCYQPATATDEPKTHEVVERAIKGIHKQRPMDNNAPDAWSPQAFRPTETIDTRK